MADLLDELRAAAKTLGEQPRGVAWGYSMLMTQAANEIERLRSLAGAVSAGPDAAEVLKPLRNKVPLDISADRGEGNTD